MKFVLLNFNVFYFIQVADAIWVCENETVTKWNGNILDYKDHLKNKITDENERKKK